MHFHLSPPATFVIIVPVIKEVNYLETGSADRLQVEIFFFTDGTVFSIYQRKVKREVHKQDVP